MSKSAIIRFKKKINIKIRKIKISKWYGPELHGESDHIVTVYEVAG